MRAHAPKLSNARIDKLTEKNLRRAVDSPNGVTERLQELDREWDLDRAIMVAFAALGGVALTLGLRRDPRRRFPLAAQVSFLLLHSVVGWSPQAMALRLLGFRTRQEIEAERQALLTTAPQAG